MGRVGLIFFQVTDVEGRKARGWRELDVGDEEAGGNSLSRVEIAGTMRVPLEFPPPKLHPPRILLFLVLRLKKKN